MHQLPALVQDPSHAYAVSFTRKLYVTPGVVVQENEAVCVEVLQEPLSPEGADGAVATGAVTVNGILYVPLLEPEFVTSVGATVSPVLKFSQVAGVSDV